MTRRREAPALSSSEYPGPEGTRFRETRSADGTGWCELGIYRGAVLLGVVSHPRKGAAWFVHPPGGGRPQRYRTRGAAVYAVMS